ncbi:hypothetical protein [Stenotrophomonas sp. 364]|jgi:hypothetical protein|uniref:hypothetical protein n=1 Tax=Stenotrophomonas sp. 364 TaxID=2691571 RepID=UPI001316562C|nr:hypothetical protein [Stenotrophomonas sp. 364]QHB72987.1 hypothetical protein GQ674_17555 [Stenotrophomonas sp. 364]
MFMKQLLTFGVAALGTAALPASASDATLKGAFALSGTAERVSAELWRGGARGVRGHR